MKRLAFCIGLLASLIVSYWGLFGWTQPALAGEGNLLLAATAKERVCLDRGQKIDLNNANLVAFTDCPGFYPNLAAAIVASGPYDKVEDVLKLPDLSARQKELLQANLDNFMVTEPVVPLEMRMPPRPAMGKFSGQVNVE